MDDDKIKAIEEYLRKHFPDAKVANHHDFDRYGHKFRIVVDHDILLFSISTELSSRNTTDKLITILDNYNLIKMLIDNPDSTIVVTSKRIYPVNRF